MNLRVRSVTGASRSAIMTSIDSLSAIFSRVTEGQRVRGSLTGCCGWSMVENYRNVKMSERISKNLWAWTLASTLVQFGQCIYFLLRPARQGHDL